MRWTERGKKDNNGTTILYSGHEHLYVSGVGLILNRNTAKALIGRKPVSDRKLAAKLQSRYAKTTIIQVYASTEEADEDENDSIYELLQDSIDQIPNQDIKLLMGDLNAQIDQNRQGLEHVIAPHGSAEQTNDNGERLLLFCSANSPCIGNSYFDHKGIHKKTVKARLVNYICIGKRRRSAMQNVGTFRGADVGSDHYMAKASLKLK